MSVGAEDHRYRDGRTDDRGADRQYFADVTVRRATQRDGAKAVQGMVDAICAEISRAEHVCLVRQSGAPSLVLAMASDAGRDVADRRSVNRDGHHGPVVCWLVPRLNLDVPDQSL